MLIPIVGEVGGACLQTFCPNLNNVQSGTFSKETWWGHNIDNSIDNFDILFNVAEPSHFIEEREWGEVTIRQT